MLFIELKQVNRLKIFIILVYSLSLALASVSGNLLADGAALSNLMPVELVKQLQSQGMWRPEYDLPSAKKEEDLLSFWYLLRDQQFGSNKDQNDDLFEAAFGGSQANPKVLNLEPVKFAILRYLNEQEIVPTGFNKTNINIYMTKWQSRYIENAFAAISISGIQDYAPIVTEFRSLYKNKTITIRDLSPRERDRLSKVISSSHSLGLFEKVEGNDRYKITGIYNASSKYFAVDFARPLSETLVTFAHEMVHAADPKLIQFRKDYKETFSEISKLFLDVSGIEDSTIAKELDVISTSFEQSDLLEFAKSAKTIREQRTQYLKNEQTRSAFDKVYGLKDKQHLIQKWIRSIIGLTIENEYRAYGLSALLYSSLKDKFNLFPPDDSERKYVENFLAGDEISATVMTVGANPIPAVHRAILRQLDQTKYDPYTTANINEFMRRLEFCFLTETENFLLSLNNRFAGAMTEIRTQAKSNRYKSVLPKWAEPGNWDLPTNPYNILKARVSTAAVVEFSKRADIFAKGLQLLNSTPLLNLSNGILDISNVSQTELKLIGIWYENSPFQSAPSWYEHKNLEPEMEMNLSEYLSTIPWNPESALDGKQSLIDGVQVAQNLILLRTIRALGFLNKNFPTYNTDILSTKVFLQKLTERVVLNPEEMSEERLLQLKTELQSVLSKASSNKSSIGELEEVLKNVGVLYQMSENMKWNKLSEKFFEASKQILAVFDDLGIDGKRSFEEGQDRIKNWGLAIKTQLAPSSKRCSKVTGSNIELLRNVGPIKIEDESFPLTVICYKRGLYAVRQPGDFTGYMTTLETPDQTGPRSNIFLGSRFIKLFPVAYPNNNKVVK